MSDDNRIIEATPTTLLYWARRREEGGDLFGARVCLRLAIERQLRSMARCHDCLPKNPKWHGCPTRLADALHTAGVLDDRDHEWTLEAIAAAVNGEKSRDMLRGSIQIIALIVETWPNGIGAELVAAKGGAV